LAEEALKKQEEKEEAEKEKRLSLEERNREEERIMEGLYKGRHTNPVIVTLTLAECEVK